MTVKDISVSELEAKRQSQDSGSFLLLDVREPWECELAAVSNSVHIPMNQIPDRMSELPTDQEIIVMCHHGGRSMQVAQYLAHQGYKDISNLTGGIHIWSQEVDQSVPTY